MNPVFLLFIFLYISSSYSKKCKTYDFKLQIPPKDCVCKDLSYSPKGRIFNGTNLDSRDLPYVAVLYAEKNIRESHLLKRNFIFYH